MLSLTPRFVRRVLLPASYLVFVAGTVVSGASFYRGRVFDAKAAILSDLQSADDNPNGYGASAGGTAVSAILLIPAAALFYRRLRKNDPKLALAGVAMLVAGLASAIAMGFLAPFTHGYTPLHIQLAAAAFIGVCAGVSLHLLAARAAPALVVFQFAALPMLIYLCYGPMHFDNARLLTGLAFWEWVLCLDCGVALWVLAARIEANATLETPRKRAVAAAD